MQEVRTMKITGVKTFPITAGGRNFHFVKVETDEGVSGIGKWPLGRP